MIITLLILGISVVLFVSGKVRPDMVAIGALLCLMLFNILTPEEALSGFSNPIVIMMIGLFVIGGGIIQTGLANVVSERIMRYAGDSPYRIYLLLILTTAGIGAFVSNTGTVALMLPIVVSLAATTGINASRLLMPLAFASSMGGMLTLIGTPPNLVISDELVKAGYDALSFFSFTPVGMVVVVIGVLAMWPLSKKFLTSKKENNGAEKVRKSLQDLVTEYQLSKNQYRLLVNRKSSALNKQVRELDGLGGPEIIVLGIERKIKSRRLFTKPSVQQFAGPDVVLMAGDMLYVKGQPEDIAVFVEANQLQWADSEEDGAGKPFEGELSFTDMGIAEVVVLSNSRLVNRLVKESGLRANYRLNVVGIHRNNQYLLDDIKNIKIQSGDALLIQGTWEDIALLDSQARNIVVLGQPMSDASNVTIDYKTPLAALIMLGMVTALAFNLMPAVTAVMLAGVLIVITGCLRNVEAAYRTINWESIILIGAMLPMSMALEKTGVSLKITEAIVGSLGDLGPIFILAGIYLATSCLTMFINNTATAVLFAPIAMQAAVSMEVSPYPLLFAVTVAASMCFSSPFATAPNAMVMSAGRYRFVDYVKVGLPLQLLIMIAMMVLLPLLFPF